MKNDEPAPVVDSQRKGGYEVWSPMVTPGIGVDLTDEQKLAIVFRWLAREGFAENLIGHITWQRPDKRTMLVNPWGLWWREISASDVCEVDDDGSIVSGRWDVTPAIHIHTALHRRRPDARVIIHNHPYYSSLLASIGALPELVHQSDSLFFGDLQFVEEYSGEIDSIAVAAELAARVGDAQVVVLASHGVLVTGENIEQASYRAASLERSCRLAVHTRLLGSRPLPLDPNLVAGIKSSLLERGSDVHFAGMARQLIRLEPDVLN